jgi:hypothetical protein
VTAEDIEKHEKWNKELGSYWHPAGT